MFNKPDYERYIEDALSGGTMDITIGFVVLVIGWMLSLVNYMLGVTVGLALAGYFFYTWLRDLFNQDKFERNLNRWFAAQQKQKEPEASTLASKRTQPNQASQIQPTSSAPLTNEPTIADKIKAVHKKNDFKCPNCGATVEPTDTSCNHCGSIIVDFTDFPRPAKWADFEIGQQVELKHPQKGQINLSVQQRVYYAELWQAQMRQDVPWTLTGNYYVGLVLDQKMFLLNWQGRFYLLDSKSPLTDMDINQKFAKAAREFAASNQTKYVTFILDTVWKMEDIGRFRIEYTEGEGMSVSPGAIGRFIHASHDNRILVVEDYQSGGSGLDTQWMGYRIEEDDIKF